MADDAPRALEVCFDEELALQKMFLMPKVWDAAMYSCGRFSMSSLMFMLTDT